MSTKEGAATETSQSMCDLVLDAYVKNIPMESLQEDNIPFKWKIVFGFITYVIFGALFLSSLITGYEQAITEEFISFDQESGICKSVPKSLTGSYLMDINGTWEGEIDFEENKALYQFEFNSLQINNEEFIELMDTLR